MPKVIDVYLGFMDEEVNARLKAVIDQEKASGNAARPVILIERNKVGNSDPILQWPRSQYGVTIKPTILVSPTAMPDAGLLPEQILSRAIGVFMEADHTPAKPSVPVLRYFQLQQLLNESGPGKTKTPLSGEGPWLSLIRFGVGKDTNPPIVVIRTPEMGLQPSLVSPWVEFLLQMISPFSSQLAHEAGDPVEWPVRVSCFGAQGGTQPGVKPGDITRICASLFVGVEFDDGQAYGTVRLQTYQYEYTFFCQAGAGETLKDRAADAEKLARTRFADWQNLKVLSAAGPYGDWAEPEPLQAIGTLVKDVIQVVKQFYCKQVSMTASFFVPEADKAVAQALGLNSAGMEDSHVIKGLRLCAAKGELPESLYPRLDPARAYLARINCDPHKIDDKVLAAFNSSIVKAQLTPTDYADVIVWGLNGVLKEEIPDCARWAFAADPVFEDRPGLLEQTLYAFAPTSADDPVVADPFCVEIATDFIADLANPTTPGITGLGGTQLEQVRRLAANVREQWQQHQGGRKAWEAAAMLMLYLIEACGFEAKEKGKAKTWLRPGKWEGITKSPTLQDLSSSGEQFAAAALDRAFYKSSNLMALQTLAQHSLL
ncbi:MAG: hypothetical protein JWN15_2123 [Firmicutes bacterium]|nr:hypothetical protein [Bacillota bacterium]